MRKYTLELDEFQYGCLAECIEVVHLITCGKMQAINRILPKKVDKSTLMKIKSIAFPELKESIYYNGYGEYAKRNKSELVSENKFNEEYGRLQALTFAIYYNMRHISDILNDEDNGYADAPYNIKGIDIPKITLITTEEE